MRNIYEIIEEINKLNSELITAIQAQEKVYNHRLEVIENKQRRIKEGLEQIVNNI